MGTNLNLDSSALGFILTYILFVTGIYLISAYIPASFAYGAELTSEQEAVINSNSLNPLDVANKLLILSSVNLSIGILSFVWIPISIIFILIIVIIIRGLLI